MSKLGIEAFATRDRANQGVKLPLHSPEGEETDHWIQVKGVDSDDFQKAIITRADNAMKLQDIEDIVEKEAAIKKETCDLLATIVADWSFSDEKLLPDGAKPMKCTPKNVSKFLLDAPQIRNQIDKLISDREAFFTEQSKGS